SIQRIWLFFLFRRRWLSGQVSRLRHRCVAVSISACMSTAVCNFRLSTLLEQLFPFLSGGAYSSQIFFLGPAGILHVNIIVITSFVRFAISAFDLTIHPVFV